MISSRNHYKIIIPRLRIFSIIDSNWDKIFWYIVIVVLKDPEEK